MNVSEFLVSTFSEIKLEKFKEAVEDCTAVLKLEPSNTKGLPFDRSP